MSKNKQKPKATAKKPKKQRKLRSSNSKGYDFNKPFFAQDLGDEWDDYVWSGSDF